MKSPHGGIPYCMFLFCKSRFFRLSVGRERGEDTLRRCRVSSGCKPYAALDIPLSLSKGINVQVQAQSWMRVE